MPCALSPTTPTPFRPLSASISGSGEGRDRSPSVGRTHASMIIRNQVAQDRTSSARPPIQEHEKREEHDQHNNKETTMPGLMRGVASTAVVAGTAAAGTLTPAEFQLGKPGVLAS